MSASPPAPAVNVVALVCSPGGSRTAQHANLVLRGAADSGAEAMQVDCGDGQANEQVLEAIERADAVLFAAPTYRGQAAWPLKALLDHIPRDRDGISVLQGKAAGTLLTADSAHHFLGVEATRSVLCDFFAMQVLSPSLYIPRTGFDDPTGSRAAQRCHDYGAALTDLARWLANSHHTRKLHPLV